MRKVKLLTKEIRKSIPPLYAQDGKGEAALVFAKFFHPYSSGVWLATEGQPVLDENEKEIDFRFFGFVKGQHAEYGYFLLSEMEAVRVNGCPMERDRGFPVCTLGEAKKREGIPTNDPRPVVGRRVQEIRPLALGGGLGPKGIVTAHEGDKYWVQWDGCTGSTPIHWLKVKTIG